jgi:hypothetical protein
MQFCDVESVMRTHTMATPTDKFFVRCMVNMANWACVISSAGWLLLGCATVQEVHLGQPCIGIDWFELFVQAAHGQVQEWGGAARGSIGAMTACAGS